MWNRLTTGGEAGVELGYSLGEADHKQILCPELFYRHVPESRMQPTTHHASPAPPPGSTSNLPSPLPQTASPARRIRLFLPSLISHPGAPCPHLPHPCPRSLGSCPTAATLPGPPSYVGWAWPGLSKETSWENAGWGLQEVAPGPSRGLWGALCCWRGRQLEGRGKMAQWLRR